MTRAYYNEIDPYCAQWLRNLISAGHIAAGDVDERSIEKVSADDVRPYTQAHFFAGIGGWSLAARLAGWPDDRPLWTGSCPCQPFSNAGKRLAYSDPRNLWPHFARLIADCRPPAVAGEQVASKAGRLWLAGVRADLEALGYGVGAADLCAAGVGAPHIRQRLWWVADSDGWQPGQAGAGRLQPGGEYGQQPQDSGGLADAGRASDERGLRPGEAPGAAGATQGEAQQQQRRWADAGSGVGAVRGAPGESGRAGENDAGPWAGAVWIPCADGKARRIEPGLEPLAHGVPARVGKLRAYGNAIVPQEAAEVIRAIMEVEA